MRTLSYIGLIALCFAQYLTTAIPGYLVLLVSLLLGAGIRLPLRIVLYICAVAVYWLAVLSYGAGKSVFTHMLFYFGFLIPFLVFASSKRIEFDFLVNEKVIIGLCLFTMLEAVLFNSPIAQQLYLFPAEGESDRVNFFGFYQRPLGVGSNASMTSIVLFFLIILYEQMRGTIKGATQVLVLLTTIVLASGTAFGLLLFYVATRMLRAGRLSAEGIVRRMIYLLIFLTGIATALGYFGTFEDFGKYTIDYFAYLVDYKIYTLEATIEAARLETTLFGHQIDGVVATTGDFGFLVTPDAIGLIGTALLFIAPLLFPGAVARNIVPTVLFYLSFFHYPGLLTAPGQILFASYLCILARTGRKTEESLSLRSSDLSAVRAAPARS